MATKYAAGKRHGGDPRVEVTVRRWSIDAQAFMTDGAYELCLPRGTAALRTIIERPETR